MSLLVVHVGLDSCLGQACTVSRLGSHCFLRCEGLPSTHARRPRRQPAKNPRVAQLSRGLQGRGFPDAAGDAGRAAGIGTAQAGLVPPRTRHPLDDRGFRQHADRRAGGRPAAARRGRKRNWPTAPGDRRRQRAVDRAEHLLGAKPLLRRRPRVRPAGFRRRPGRAAVRLRDRHRRRAGHHGGGQPRRRRRGGEVGRPEHPPAPRAAAQPVHHARPLLPVPLLRHAEAALPACGRRPWWRFPAGSARSTNCSTP